MEACSKRSTVSCDVKHEYLTFGGFKWKWFRPSWCGSVDWVQACKQKGHGFHSQSGHMPGLQARLAVGGAQEATTHWCSSTIAWKAKLVSDKLGYLAEESDHLWLKTPHFQKFEPVDLGYLSNRGSWILYMFELCKVWTPGLHNVKPVLQVVLRQLNHRGLSQLSFSPIFV